MENFTIDYEHYTIEEGQSYIIFICRAANNLDAIRQFKERFDDFYLLEARIKKGLHFDSDAAKMLISESTINMLQGMFDDGTFSYYASMHYNLS